MTTMESRDAPMSDHEAAVVRDYDDSHELWLGRSRQAGTHAVLFDAGQAPDELGLQPWDEETARLSVEGMRRMTDAATAPAAIGENDYVVDAGCGFGAVAVHLSRKHGCRTTGVNINRRQLEAAKEVAAAAGMDELVDFRYADCSRHLPFADASVDVVVNMESACYYSDRPRFLSEVARILKPGGGRLVTEDYMVRDDLTAEDYRRNVEPFCRTWVLHSLESPASYARKLEETGLQVVEFAGFDGADAFNLRNSERTLKFMTRALFSSPQSPGFLDYHRRIGAHALALRDGCVFLHRFLARKP